MSRRVFFKKEVLKNFAKFTGRPVLETLFDKVASVRPAFLLRKTPTQVFSDKFYEIFKNTFFTEHLWATGNVTD